MLTKPPCGDYYLKMENQTAPLIQQYLYLPLSVGLERFDCSNFYFSTSTQKMEFSTRVGTIEH